jgi:hypothetical protein
MKTATTSIVRIPTILPMNQKSTMLKISITNMAQDASMIMDIITRPINIMCMDLDAIIITIIIITPPILM